jgi:alanine racemase
MKTRFSRNSLNEDPGAPPPRVMAEFSAKALENNYRVIQAQVPGHSIIPMIKANAYGHGAAWAARILAPLPGLFGFGVATLEEGTELRLALWPKWRRTRIIVFSGALPWSGEHGHYCERHGLVPVIASEEDWNKFLREKWPSRLPYALKFNTGMNRLGIGVSFARALVRSLKNKPADWQPESILSHLAMGDSPDSRLSLFQRKQFETLKQETASAFPSAHFHLANSSAIWSHKDWRLDGLTDIVRPGISLYGVPPWPGAPERGLCPVLTLKAKVISVHKLRLGESLGYGAAFKVKDTDSMRVAILAAGYADGVLRSLSGEGSFGGYAWISGQASRFLGRVSMDLSAIHAWISGLSPVRQGQFLMSF